MEWRHNLLGPQDNPFRAIGEDLQASPRGSYSVFMRDQSQLVSWRMEFSAEGRPGPISEILDHPYDALLPWEGGYLLPSFKLYEARIHAFDHDHRPLWTKSIKDADSPVWGIAPAPEGRLFLLYSECNPYDAFRTTKVSLLEPGQGEIENYFTVPDIEFPNPQLLVPLRDRVGVCSRSQGAHVMSYVLDDEGEISRAVSFNSHPHSRWAVPCSCVSLESGETLMGGYQEHESGRREPWVARFDADLTTLVGRNLPAASGERMVSAVKRCADGTIFCLCPPWAVYRLSPKGHPIQYWEVPEGLKRNSIHNIQPTPDGGCLLTGRSFTRRSGTEPLEPSTWLCKIQAGEFINLSKQERRI